MIGSPFRPGPGRGEPSQRSAFLPMAPGRSLLLLVVSVLTSLVVSLSVTAAQGAALHRCAHAPNEGRLAVSVSPGPGCDGAAILARKLWRAAERRFPRPLPRHYAVDTPSPPASASPATFRFRCTVSSKVVESRQAHHPVRVTSARCANERGSRFRYSFTMA